jgi:hypothetical protein
MKALFIVIVILIWNPPSVVSSVKNSTVFDKCVDFLVGHISGEVLIYQNSGNDHLANNIIDKINQQERTGLITVVDASIKNSGTDCTRCNWFVILQKFDSVVCVKIPN